MAKTPRRTKEIMYSDSTDSKGRNYRIKEKVVTTPNKEKKVRVVSKVRENKRPMLATIATSLAGGALSAADASRRGAENKSTSMLRLIAPPLAGLALGSMIDTKKNKKVISRTKTITKKKK